MRRSLGALAFFATLYLISGNSWLGIEVASAQLTPNSPPTTGTNVPNPLAGQYPQSQNFGPPWRLDMGNGQPVYRSGGNLPLMINGHLNVAAGAAGPTYVSGGGGSASFDADATDSRFVVTTSATPSTSVTLAFGNSPSVWTKVPTCEVEPRQAATTNVWTNITLSPLQLTINWTGSTASAVFDVLCVGHSFN